jgi:hypothetical protein
MLDIYLWDNLIDNKRDIICLLKINTIQFMIKQSNQYNIFMSHIQKLIKKEIFPIARTLYMCLSFLDTIIPDKVYTDLILKIVPNQLYINTDDPMIIMINMHFLLMNKIFLIKLDRNIILNNLIKFLKIIRKKLNNKNNS